MSLDYGPQYHPPELIRWSLRGSLAQDELSAAGPNGIANGGAMTYLAGYFGGSAYVARGGAPRVYTPSYLADFNLPAGCLEFWLYTDYNVVNGVNSMPGFQLNFFTLSRNPWVGTDYVMAFLNNAGWRWWIYRGGVAQGFGAGGMNPPLMDWLANAWHHHAFVWQETGIGGGPNTCRYYLDAVLVASTNNALTMPTLNPGRCIMSNYDPSANAGIGGRMDNFKLWNYAKTDFSDRFTEGYTPPPPAPGPRAYEIPAQRAPVIEIGGLDISRIVGDMPEILEERGMRSDIRFPDSCRVLLRNFDGGASADLGTSLFSTPDWQDRPLTIYDSWGFRVWDGLTTNVDVDQDTRTTTIESRSPLHRYKDTVVVYLSAGDETPAAALRGIMAAIDFEEYEDAELSLSEAAQAGINIWVTLTAANRVTFSQAIDMLCILGCADCYEHLGRLRYSAWTDDTPRKSGIALDEGDILGAPRISRLLDEVVNDYAIYESSGAGTTRQDATEGNVGADSRMRYSTKILQGPPSAVDARWDVRDQASAVEIGERWIRRTHANFNLRPTARWGAELTLRLHHRAWVQLGCDFALTYAREGWDGKIFRVTGFRRSDADRTIQVTAQEWGE